MRKYLRALHSNLCRVGVLDSDVDMLLEYLTVCNKLSSLPQEPRDRAMEFLKNGYLGDHFPGDVYFD